jgi:hypothetical protein
MWLNVMILLLSLQLSTAQSGSGTDDVTYISEPSDLDQLHGLTRFSGSLFFHSGMSISTTDLCEISTLEQIDGYLTIWRSPGIRNLKCLRNLKTIAGDDLQFGHPPTSVFIEDNVNESTGVGLCFVDTLNWTLITNEPVSVRDNGHSCPSCHAQCATCWGAGPRLCQTCTNYRSGVTCVDTCSTGTIEHTTNKTCTEHLLPELNINNLIVHQELWNKTVNVTFNWSAVSQPNGVPLGYRLVVDNVTVHEQVYEDYLPTNDGMVESPSLKTSHKALLNYSRNYTVQLQVLNSVGWSSLSDSYTVSTMDAVPSTVQDLNVSFDHNDTTVSWSQPSFTGGSLVRYQALFGFPHNRTLAHHIVTLPNQTNHTMELACFVSYRVCVRAYNQDWVSPPNCLDFTVPHEHPPTVTNLTVDVFNATFANASWSVEEDEYGHEDHDQHTHVVHLQLVDNENNSHDDHDDHDVNDVDSEDDILFETNNSNVVFDHLRPNSSYMLEVYCLYGHGAGEVATVNFSTPAHYPPVTNLAVDVFNATYANASWSVEEDEHDEHEDHDEHTHVVHLQLVDNDIESHHEHHEHHEHGTDSEDDILFETNNSHVVFDNLKPNSSYMLQVHCLHDYGDGEVSTVNFSTPTTNPPTPDTPIIVNNTLTDIWISVEPVSDENGYVTDYTLEVEHLEQGVIEDSDTISLGRFTVNQTISLSSLVHLHDDHEYRLRLIAYVGNLSTSSSYSTTSELISTSTTTTSTTTTGTTTTSTTTTHTVQKTGKTNDNDNDGMDLWLILLIAFCVTLGIVIVILGAFVIRKNQKDRKDNGGDLKATLRDSYVNPTYTGIPHVKNKAPRTTQFNGTYTTVSTGPMKHTKVLPHVDDEVVNVYDTAYDYNKIKDNVPDMVPANMAGIPNRQGSYVSVDGVGVDTSLFTINDDGTMDV